MLAEDRVLVALPSLNAVWMKLPVHPDPEPERAVVAEDDLALRRLAEQAHVGDAAVRDEIAGAGRVPRYSAPTASPYCVFSISPQTAAISTSPRSRTPASCSARTAST